MNKRKICVVTGSRSEYGFLCGLMKAIQEDSLLTLQVVVTGTHLSAGHGMTYKVIRQDGFRINEKIRILTGDDTAAGIAKSMGKAMVGFSDVLGRLKPDILVLFGDRYEMMACAQAALMAKIPVAHIGGGDTTQGAFDEAIRHSITKMSHLHFVSSKEAARRVHQLGEDPENIFNVGSLIMDQIKRLRLLDKKDLEKSLGFKLRKRNLLITFHPITLDPDPPSKQFQELLNALDEFGQEVGLIFTKPNSDPQGSVISKMIDRYVHRRSHAKAYVSLGHALYLNAIRYVDAAVGNSSSGLYEVPLMKKPTVNIGDRQKGRLWPSSVIHCPAKKVAIKEAIRQALTKDCSRVVNPYGEGDTAAKIVKKLKEIAEPGSLIKKKFFDEYRPSPVRRVFIVAEAGVNHNGSLKMAKKLIDSAVEAGADAVKFQTFVADKVVSKYAPKAEYQKRTTSRDESQWEMIKKLELSKAAHLELIAYCQKRSIEFLSSPFDLESLDLLSNKLRLQRLKIPSGEITNAPLLLRAARTGLPLIVSTGMATLEEVKEALQVLAFGCIPSSDKRPSREAFRQAYRNPEAREILSSRVALLHCTTEYPAPFEEVNLRAMDTLGEVFGLPVGLSDHTEGIAIAIAAAARGAVIIEKHFTLDRDLPGPDHRASLEPDELKLMVTSIRQVEGSLGDGQKVPAPCELKNKPIARKSLVAARTITAGEFFSERNLTVKRPGSGMSPFRYWELLGQRAGKDFYPDEEIR